MKKMKKLTVVAREILALNFKQAYEVLLCKCNCWEGRRQAEVAK